MRVYNHVWHNAFSSEGKIFLSVGHTASTFLTMTRGKLITDLRNSNSSHLNLGELLILFISSNDNRINDTTLSMLERSRAILELPETEVTLIRWNSLSCGLSNFSDNNIIAAYLNARLNQTIMIKFIIGTCLLARSFTTSKIWNTEDLITLLTVIVSSEENRPEEASVYSTLVQHN